MGVHKCESARESPRRFTPLSPSLQSRHDSSLFQGRPPSAARQLVMCACMCVCVCVRGR